MAALEKAIDNRTVCSEPMFVNNETGVIFPINEIKQIILRDQLHSSTVMLVLGYGKLNFSDLEPFHS